MTATQKKIVKRILLLIVPIIAVFAWRALTFDPHSHDTADGPCHVDGYVGIALLSLLWFYCWLAFVLLEMIIYVIKVYRK